jgi:hypothetical protein
MAAPVPEIIDTLIIDLDSHLHTPISPSLGQDPGSIWAGGWVDTREVESNENENNPSSY